MESREMATLAVAALEDKKGEEIRIIDISEVSVLADYFIIANGSNRSQVQVHLRRMQIPSVLTEACNMEKRTTL